MNQLTSEQEMMIRKSALEKGYDPDYAVKTILNIGEVFQHVKSHIISLFMALKARIQPLIDAYKRHRHEQNVKFFKKKKSQRKNWSKWKKRKR